MNTQQSIPAVAQAAAMAFGEAEAVVDAGRRVSFRQLAEDAARAAQSFMAAGIQPADRVAIWAPNSYEWVVALLGLQSAGAWLVPLNTRLRGVEAAYVLNRSRARMLVTAEGFLGIDFQSLLEAQELPHLERTIVITSPGAVGAATTAARSTTWEAFLGLGEDVPVDELARRVSSVRGTDVSDIIFTSGTTGWPKGVVSTHGQSIRTFAEWSHLVGLRAGDRYLLVNPMFHTFGYKAGILASLLTGATIVPMPAFDAGGALRLIQGERITVLPGPPTLYQSLLKHPARDNTNIASLRLAVTGAAAIPVDLVRRIRDHLGFETVLTAYGLTEATGFVTATRIGDDIETIATTSGRAIDGCVVRVVAPGGTILPPGQPGEIVCRGYNVMKGYFEDPEQTALAIDAEGWLHTGDIGTIDSAGNLKITDRLKDMFIVGGFNAYPAEIENLLLRHPAIGQVAVVGVPDERLGEVGVAFVVPRRESMLEPAEVIVWAGDNMANYKVPREVIEVDELPLNASGKVVKYELRRRVAEADAGTL